MLAILANVIPHFYTLVAYFIYTLNPQSSGTGREPMCSVGDQRPGSVHMECTQRVHTWGVGGADSKIGSRQGDFGFG